MEIRFCHVDEVNRKRSRQICFKQAFYLNQDMLKTQGQKLHEIQLFHKHVEEHLDSLYDRRPDRYREYLRAGGAEPSAARGGSRSRSPFRQELEELEGRPADSLTDRQKGVVYRAKRKFAEQLLADFETALRQKKVYKREKFLTEVFRECKPGTSYAKKNTYLEERIELTSKYFGYMHDLKHKNKDMQKLRKDLFKMTR